MLQYSTTLIASFIAVATFGIWIPLVGIALSYPRFKIQRERGNLGFSLFNKRTPVARQMRNVSEILQAELSVIEVRMSGSRNILIKRLSELQQKMLESMGKPLHNFLKKLWIPITIEA